MYKTSSSSKVSFLFESKRAREKLQVTEIHSRFGEGYNYQFPEIAILSSWKWKEPIFVTLFLPEYVSDQAVRLAFSNFGKDSVWFLANINLTEI